VSEKFEVKHLKNRSPNGNAYLGLCGLIYSILLKVNNSVAAKVEYLTGEKKIKNIKIQLPAISMHGRLPQPLISMSIQLNYIQIGRLLRNRRYWFPILFSLSVVLKYKLPVPVY
jgi:hypothetical protein